MNKKSVFAAALALACSVAVAETGLEGGRDGLHQQSAKTLGQGGLSIGIGAEGIADSRPMTYQYYYIYDGQFVPAASLAPSISGNFHAAVGVLDFVDLGIVLPINYDDANASTKGAKLNGWGFGDLQAWTKVRLPVFDTTDVLNVALLGQVYFPTGEKAEGMRPRHVWYVNSYGPDYAFTANDWAFEGSLLLTLDFNKLGIPLRWNNNIGYVGVLHEGQNTMLYGTGLNLTAIQAMDLFVEFSGEMRVEKAKGSMWNWRDPLVDPMRLTPGVRFHLAQGVDLAVGADIGITAFLPESKKYDKFMHMDKHQGGHNVEYNVGAAEYGMSALLTWRGNPFVTRDEDKDGVEDDKDKCAHTPSGVKVNAEGCPLDSDKDGIPDYKDKCENTPAGTFVDSLGCPFKKDTVVVHDTIVKIDTVKLKIDTAAICKAGDVDHDGVPDGEDQCPNDSGTVANHGCPLDNPDVDHDSVCSPWVTEKKMLDVYKNVCRGLDKCPYDSGSVANNGCPTENPDVDKDGVCDPWVTQKGMLDAFKGICTGLDKCPYDSGSVASKGCPLDNPDSDNDGVCDAWVTQKGMLDLFKDTCTGLDKCPLDSGSVENDGCVVEDVKLEVFFTSGKAKLTANSKRTLRELAKELNKKGRKNEEYEILGYSDDRGKAKVNLKLSQKRAEAVVAELVKNGVSKKRLKAIGKGSADPIADNSTAEGRELNRRIMLKRVQ